MTVLHVCMCTYIYYLCDPDFRHCTSLPKNFKENTVVHQVTYIQFKCFIPFFMNVRHLKEQIYCFRSEYFSSRAMNAVVSATLSLGICLGRTRATLHHTNSKWYESQNERRITLTARVCQSSKSSGHNSLLHTRNGGPCSYPGSMCHYHDRLFVISLSRSRKMQGQHFKLGHNIPNSLFTIIQSRDTT
jgi:hypothetical protein